MTDAFCSKHSLVGPRGVLFPLASRPAGGRRWARRFHRHYRTKLRSHSSLVEARPRCKEET